MVLTVEAELAVLERRRKGLGGSLLAATARSMAVELDNAGNSATSKSMCARVLMDVWSALQEMAPPATEGDKLDELAKRRAARLARGSGT